METLIIQSENSREIKLLKEIVTKMGLKTAQLTHEQVEDIGLSLSLTQRLSGISRKQLIITMSNKQGWENGLKLR